MAPPEPRRLIVNADDFGRSSSINAAVVRAHREGILTSASLMVNEPACDEAVKLALENPKLGVGLHLSLVCGRAALSPKAIPDLVNVNGEFVNNAVAAGFRFFFLPRTRKQIEDEIEAQFCRFHATGLSLDHVNGHLNIHLHPTVLQILMQNAERWGVRHLRLTADPIGLNFRVATGKFFYRLSHGVIYKILSRCAEPKLRAANISYAKNVFGLLQNGRVTEEFLLKLLPDAPSGDSELYSHPSLDEFKHELNALISPRVKDSIKESGIELIRYQDL